MAAEKLDSLLERLWKDFSSLNPQASAIHSLLEGRGERIINDHIAFRTFSDPRVNIDRLARPFEESGYVFKEKYVFEQKNLDARHYEHPDSSLPKIFISELRLSSCSKAARRIVDFLLSQIPEETFDAPELCAAGRPWEVSFSDANQLATESEYAGWMAAFGFRANHFTVFVNALKTIGSLQELNLLLKQAGFALNSDGGEVKGSPGDLLEQSSTLAPLVSVDFSDGVHEVPGCYYEFARRYPLADGTLFGGFVPKSADKIFQSTDRRGGGR